MGPCRGRPGFLECFGEECDCQPGLLFKGDTADTSGSELMGFHVGGFLRRPVGRKPETPREEFSGLAQRRDVCRNRKPSPRKCRDQHERVSRDGDLTSSFPECRRGVTDVPPTPTEPLPCTRLFAGRFSCIVSEW